MFNTMVEITGKQDYEKRLQEAAQENYAAKVERANRTQAPLLTRLGESLAHLGKHLQRQPHLHWQGEVIQR